MVNGRKNEEFRAIKGSQIFSECTIQRNVMRGEFPTLGSRSDPVNQPYWSTGHLFYPSFLDLYASRDI
jgi:hypothetical protein